MCPSLTVSVGNIDMLLTQTQLTRRDVTAGEAAAPQVLALRDSEWLTDSSRSPSATYAGSSASRVLSTEITIVFLKTHTDTTHGRLSAPRTKLAFHL